MTKAVFPGSFDPFTKGHMDIVERAGKLFDKVVIAAGRSFNKNCLFEDEEKLAIIKSIYQDNPKVEVVSFDGLVVDFARSIGAGFLVRGLRTEADFSYEMPMAITNQKINPDIQTIFLPTNLQFAYVSSSIVKELCHHGADVSAFVPAEVLVELNSKFKLE